MFAKIFWRRRMAQFYNMVSRIAQCKNDFAEFKETMAKPRGDRMAFS